MAKKTSPRIEGETILQEMVLRWEFRAVEASHTLFTHFFTILTDEENVTDPTSWQVMRDFTVLFLTVCHVQWDDQHRAPHTHSVHQQLAPWLSKIEISPGQMLHLELHAFLSSAGLLPDWLPFRSTWQFRVCAWLLLVLPPHNRISDQITTVWTCTNLWS